MENNFSDTSYLFSANASFIEEKYQSYLQNPGSVDQEWQSFFAQMGDSLDNVLDNYRGASWSPKDLRVIGAKKEPSKDSKPKSKVGGISEEACLDSINALMLIRAYKVRGHLLANLDPLGLTGNKPHPDLDPTTYGFSNADLEKEIFLGGALGFKSTTLRELITTLQSTYSGTIGVEFMHIPELEQRDWIAEKIEDFPRVSQTLSSEEKISILDDITKVELFEQFLHTKFPGAKRFSAEGAEAMVAAMEKIIECAAGHGIEEVIIGMPHRGRLNVLTKVMGRRYASMLSEFQGNQAHFSEDIEASGDVKYHQGASSNRSFSGKDIHLSLTANPSHLEAVNPVVAGKVRAKQDQKNDTERKKVLGVLLHGDAAFAGQGVVPETISLSDLEGYTTGGTIHIIVNNQIGFTTSPKNARNSPYPSDIAKGAHAPIFHVNGDDPEAVAYVSMQAVNFKHKFQKEVVVDVFCYRRYGHNEGDEPFFTQPQMYTKIKNHPTPMNVYSDKLISENIISQQDFQNMKDSFHGFLEEEFKESQDYEPDDADWLKGKWQGLVSPKRGIKPDVNTGIKEKTFKGLGKTLSSIPENVKANKKLERLFTAKQKIVESGENIDWAMAESLAFASLLAEGYPVRLTGQDATRGTFSHRHSGLVDQETEEKYYPLKNISKDQARFEVVDSNLSEYAVLGFEYGYSLAEPNGLTLWEAQFGDFANGAQIMIDQFIASGEIKWLRFSGLVMLLPHGYEGQGPEHSSARLERFLQLCAEDNMQVINCTTPANIFHALRRQLHRDFRKPLVVMTPKSLLRHKKCVSVFKDIEDGTCFKRTIAEHDKSIEPKNVKKVIICSGKVYYDLLEERESRNNTEVALVRLEQYYPFPAQEIKNEILKYKNAELFWCQEEPKNAGAWFFVESLIEDALEDTDFKYKRPKYIGRKAAASPAAGYARMHKAQLQEFLDIAFSNK